MHAAEAEETFKGTRKKPRKTELPPEPVCARKSSVCLTLPVAADCWKVFG